MPKSVSPVHIFCVCWKTPWENFTDLSIFASVWIFSIKQCKLVYGSRVIVCLTVDLLPTQHLARPKCLFKNICSPIPGNFYVNLNYMRSPRITYLTWSAQTRKLPPAFIDTKLHSRLRIDNFEITFGKSAIWANSGHHQNWNQNAGGHFGHELAKLHGTWHRR